MIVAVPTAQVYEAAYNMMKATAPIDNVIMRMVSHHIAVGAHGKCTNCDSQYSK